MLFLLITPLAFFCLFTFLLCAMSVIDDIVLVVTMAVRRAVEARENRKEEEELAALVDEKLMPYIIQSRERYALELEERKNND